MNEYNLNNTDLFSSRIQQIQILLAANTSHEHKQKVWSQIEASMHLQRSKTIANMCFSKQRVKDSARNNSSSSTTTTSSSTSVQTSSSSPPPAAPTLTPETSDKNATTSVSSDATVSSISNGAPAMKTSTANGGGRGGSGRYKQVRMTNY